MPEPLEQIGDYKVIRVLGRGATGTVYLAIQESLGREVAIKVLGSDFVRDLELVERFRREGGMAAKLRHPNIVQVYDSAVRDDLCYIVMEYLGARTLADVISKGITPLEEAATYLGQLLNALQCAHTQGIVHRDIKPANIMVSDANQIALTDFSIAHLKSASKLTQTGCAMGTPQYMAPEQFDGRVDHRADLYAAAAIFYELLTGKCPFAAPTISEVMRKQLLSVPPALTSVNPFIPVPLSEVVTRALAKDPDLRFQSAAELNAAIQSALSTQEVPVQSPATSAPRENTPAQPQPVQPVAEPVAEAQPTLGETAQPAVTDAVLDPPPLIPEPSPEELLNELLTESASQPVPPKASGQVTESTLATTSTETSQPADRSEGGARKFPIGLLLLGCIVMAAVLLLGLRSLQKAPPLPTANPGLPTPAKEEPVHNTASPVAISPSPPKVASPAASPVQHLSNSKNIIPGQQIGDFRLDSSFDDLYQRSTKEKGAEIKSEPGSPTLIQLKGIQAAFAPENDPDKEKMLSLTTTAPGYSLEQLPGIAVGKIYSPEKRLELMREFGPPSIENGHEIRFVEKGLSIRFYDGIPRTQGKQVPPNTIIQIQIFPPGQDPNKMPEGKELPPNVHIPPTAKLRTGKGLGKVCLGFSKSEVAKHWKEPTPNLINLPDTWLYGDEVTGDPVCSARFDTKDQLVEIWCYDSHFVIEGTTDCRVGQHRVAFETQIKALSGAVPNDDGSIECKSMGLSLCFDDQSHCKIIKIYRPQKAEK